MTNPDLPPVFDAAPGETVLGRLVLTNDLPRGLDYHVTVVGLDAGQPGAPVAVPAYRVHVPAETTAQCEIPVPVPLGIGVGQHAAAFEITPDRPDARPTLSPFTLSIASVERVILTPVPSPIRGRRNGKFHLDVTNNELIPVAVTLLGGAEGVDVAFDRSEFELAPGERLSTKARARGPRHWSGEPTQHNVVITAKGRAAQTSITAPFIQRPVFAHRLRVMLAAFTVVALWLAAIGGAALWWINRDSGETAQPPAADVVRGVDTDSDGIPDRFFDAEGNELAASAGTDTDGDGVPDQFTDDDGNTIPVVTGVDTDGDGTIDEYVDADGNPVVTGTEGEDPVAEADAADDGSGSPAADGAAEAPTTVVRGTITADGSDQLDDIVLRLSELAAGSQPDEQSAIIGPQGFRSGKLWPAMRSPRAAGESAIRQTLPIEPQERSPGTDGTWAFSDVRIGTTYELVVSKPGFEMQSFVVSPRDDSPVAFEVELSPSTAGISGSVSGPNGLLGGVELAITDGVLSYTTTTPSEGTDVGAWSFDGLSSGQYAIVATLEGFGSVVAEFELQAGETITQLPLVMERGLGTLVGRVFGTGGDPLGGVAVTATNGEFNAESTSITGSAVRGDNVGFYSIAGLDIENPYTVTVELDGYLRETRRLPAGSLSGVNFTMRRSAVTLGGRVTSSDGSPINNAGVTLQNDLLEFRVSTDANGRFGVENLPPGTYVVTFDHFLHISESQFLDLQPGINPAPLSIVMERAGPRPSIVSGELVVKVKDSANNADVEGAEIVLRRISDGEIMLSEIGCPATCALGTTDVGTYILEVKNIMTPSPTGPVRKYNDAVPERVSLGRSDLTITIFVQELGQVVGHVVDSTDAGTRLDSLPIVTLENGGPVPIQQILDPIGFQTLPNTLVRGLYTLAFNSENVPLGYVIQDQQIQDVGDLPPNSPPPNPGPMQFRFAAGQDGPVELNPIKANPYQTISGRVYRPINSAGNTGFVAKNPGKVELSCVGAVDGTVNGADYSFTKEQVDEAVNGKNPAAKAVTETCNLIFTAGGFETKTTPIDVTVRQKGAVTSLVLNPALEPARTAFQGKVFWIDRNAAGADIPLDLDGVDIATTTAAITSFADGRAGGELPTAVTTDLAIQSANGGAWAFPKGGDADQVFGTVIYTFLQDPGFVDAAAAPPGPHAIAVEIQEDGRRVVTEIVGTDVTGPGGGPYNVQLTTPVVGDIQGTITILSERPVADRAYTDVALNWTDPAEATTTTKPAANTGAFSVDPAIAGTWLLDVDPPVGHVALDTTPLRSTSRVEPGTTSTGQFDTTLVQQGELQLRFVGTDNMEVGGSAAITATPANGTGAVTINDDADPTTKRFVFQEIPVNTTTAAATATFVNSKLTLEIAGYDLSQGEYWNNLNPTLVDIFGGNAPGTPLAGLSLPFRAGSVQPLTIRAPKFGGFSSQVLGDLAPTGTPTPTPASKELLSCDAPACADLALTALRVDRTGTPTGGTDGLVEFTATGFTVSAEPGFYKLVATPPQNIWHPDYDEVPGFLPTDPRDGTLPAGVIEVRNNENRAIDPVVLNIRKGDLTINAVQDLTDNVAVLGASCVLEPADPNVVAPCVVGANSLPPGTYTLTVSNINGDGLNLAHPARTTFVIEKSTAAVTSSLTLTVPIPPAGNTVPVRVFAQNTADPRQDIALPATVFLSSDFAEEDVEFEREDGETGTLENNAGVPTDATPPADPNSTILGDIADIALPTTNGEANVEFARVPSGFITLTAKDNLTGYELVTPPQMFGVPYTPNDPVTFQYRVPATDVTVSLAGFVENGVAGVDDFEDLSVTLDRPSTGSYTGASQPGNPLDFTFTNVAPEDGDFTLKVTHPLYADYIRTVQIGPETDPNVTDLSTRSVPLADVPMAPVKGRFMGQVLGDTGAPTDDPLPAATLTLDGNPAPLDGTTAAYDETIDIDPGTTSKSVPFVATADDFLQENRNVEIFAGQVKVVDFLLTAATTINVSVTAPGPIDGLEVVLRPPPEGIQVTPDAGTYSFGGLEPNVEYTATATDPLGRYYTKSASVTPGVSAAATPLALQLDARRVTIDVSGASGTSQIRVVGKIGGEDVDEILPAGTKKVQFSSLGSGLAALDPGGTVASPDTIPVTGGGQLIISEFGGGRRTITVPSQPAFVQTVASLPDITISGTITNTGSKAGATVTAEARAASGTGGPVLATRTGTVTGNTYSVGTLGIGDTGQDLWWSVTVAKVGMGTATTTPVQVSAANTPTNTAQDLTLAPRMVEIDFTVKTTAGGNIGGATVAIGAVSETTAGNGTVTLSLPEDATALSYTVTKAGYAEASGTVSGFPGDLSGVTGPDVTLNPQIEVTDGGTAVVGVTPTCTVPASCTLTFSATDAGGLSTVTSDLAVSTSYTISVTSGGKTGTATLATNAAGKIDSMLPLALAIT